MYIKTIQVYIIIIHSWTTFYWTTLAECSIKLVRTIFEFGDAYLCNTRTIKYKSLSKWGQQEIAPMSKSVITWEWIMYKHVESIFVNMLTCWVNFFFYIRRHNPSSSLNEIGTVGPWIPSFSWVPAPIGERYTMCQLSIGPQCFNCNAYVTLVMSLELACP